MAQSVDIFVLWVRGPASVRRDPSDCLTLDATVACARPPPGLGERGQALRDILARRGGPRPVRAGRPGQQGKHIWARDLPLHVVGTGERMKERSPSAPQSATCAHEPPRSSAETWRDLLLPREGSH